MRTIFTFLLICFSATTLFAQAPATLKPTSDAYPASSNSTQKTPVKIYNATDAVLVPCQSIYKEHPVEDYKIVKKDFSRQIEPTATRTVDAPIQLWSDIGISILIEAIPSYGIRVIIFENDDPNTFKTVDDVKILKSYFEPYSSATILEIQADYSILFK